MRESYLQEDQANNQVKNNQKISDNKKNVNIYIITQEMRNSMIL